MAVKIEKNSGSLHWKDAKILLAGDSGSGKTTFTAQDERPLFLCHEDGLAQLPVDKIRITSCTELEDSINHLEQLVSTGQFNYTSIVQDGLDDFIPQCDDAVMEWAKTKYSAEVMTTVQGIGDIPNGQGWSQERMVVMYFIRRLSNFPCAYIINSHTKQKTIGTGKNAYQKTCLNAPSERLANTIKGHMDHLVVIQQTEIGNVKKRRLNTADRIDCIGKSRGSDGLKPKPLLPNGIIWGDDPAENFKNFRAYFK